MGFDIARFILSILDLFISGPFSIISSILGIFS